MGALIYLCSANDTADRQCLPAPPASLFLSLMLPLMGQPFPTERRNCSHTFRGVLQLRRSSAPQRYNTLDFPRESRVPTGMLLAPIGNPEPRSCAPLDTPLCSCRGHLSHLGLLDFSCPNMKSLHRFNHLSTWKSVCCFAVTILLSEPHSHESDL